MTNNLAPRRQLKVFVSEAANFLRGSLDAAFSKTFLGWQVVDETH